jgi:Tfp pilus assembly protein PilO
MKTPTEPNKTKVSTKHLLVDKNNNIILYAAAVTVAVVIFSIIAANALAKQMSYQNQVISLRDSANKLLQNNVTAADSIVEAYQQFEGAQESIIGTAAKNPVIILNALPSKYDFPALTASIEALVRDSGVSLKAITGIDEEALAKQDSINPQPIEIPFQVNVTGSLASIQLLVNNLELSIRPFKIVSLNLRAADTAIGATISAITYYQPEKLLDINQYTVGRDGKLINSEGSDE